MLERERVRGEKEEREWWKDEESSGGKEMGTGK